MPEKIEPPVTDAPSEDVVTLKENASAPALKRVLGRDWLGSLVGLSVFLGGIGLLVMVFFLAKDMFSTPPQIPLDIKIGKPIDLNRASEGMTSIVVKFFLLLLMGATASLVCNRGINLYSKSRIL